MKYVSFRSGLKGISIFYSIKLAANLPAWYKSFVLGRQNRAYA